jgi:hypothetical protein
MSNRRRLARERLEIYLVHLFLAYRPLFLICALFVLLFSVALMLMQSPASFAILVIALYLFFLSSSYQALLYTARLVAWIATLGKAGD